MINVLFLATSVVSTVIAVANASPAVNHGSLVASPTISSLDAQSPKPKSSGAEPEQISAKSSVAKISTDGHTRQVQSISESSIGVDRLSAADSITALSLVITAVTLMFSLGTSWFVQRQKELGESLEKIEKLRSREEAYLNLIELRLIAEQELLQFFAFQWNSNELAATALVNVRLSLELLTTIEHQRRRDALQKLSGVIGPAYLYDLPNCRIYFQEVENYLLSNNIAQRGSTDCNPFIS